MKFFKNKKTSPKDSNMGVSKQIENNQQDMPQAITGEVSNNIPIETSNIQDAPSSEHVIGGLNWYRNQFRRSMKLNIGLLLALCIGLVIIVFLVLNRPTPQYFAATPDLRLAPLIPLDKPVLTEQGLLNWTADTITGAMSLNFLEWREKLNDLRPNFDSAAFKSFLDSLNTSGTLDMIRDKRLSVSASITKAPIIITSGLIGGKSTWRIEFPMLVSYESSQGVESTQHLMATVLVSRASTATNPRGVVIQQIVLKRNS